MFNANKEGESKKFIFIYERVFKDHFLRRVYLSAN